VDDDGAEGLDDDDELEGLLCDAGAAGGGGGDGEEGGGGGVKDTKKSVRIEGKGRKGDGDDDADGARLVWLGWSGLRGSVCCWTAGECALRLIRAHPLLLLCAHGTLPPPRLPDEAVGTKAKRSASGRAKRRGTMEMERGSAAAKRPLIAKRATLGKRAYKTMLGWVDSVIKVRAGRFGQLLGVRPPGSLSCGNQMQCVTCSPPQSPNPLPFPCHSSHCAPPPSSDERQEAAPQQQGHAQLHGPPPRLVHRRRRHLRRLPGAAGVAAAAAQLPQRGGACHVPHQPPARDG